MEAQRASAHFAYDPMAT
jgi:hypothetical protein